MTSIYESEAMAARIDAAIIEVSEERGLSIVVNVIDAVELAEIAANPDGQLSGDVDLWSLIDDLYYSGLDVFEIATMHDAVYGACLDFYYCAEYDSFYMWLGAR